jgi:hypothetical protein
VRRDPRHRFDDVARGFEHDDQREIDRDAGEDEGNVDPAPAPLGPSPDEERERERGEEVVEQAAQCTQRRRDAEFGGLRGLQPAAPSGRYTRCVTPDVRIDSAAPTADDSVVAAPSSPATAAQELDQLAKSYDRLREDMETACAERDRALDAVRHERERRARETLELTERLEEAKEREDARRAVDAVTLRERFVAERLAALPSERRKLPENALPDISGFEILARIGQGGMATVFHARRLADGVEVAVKLLHDGADASRARTELFLREAAVMLQLDHPGLVGALDAGECAYGRYLVMEVVAGESLAARVRRDGPMPEAEIVSVAVQVARALDYCARVGIVHRDVKPSNLLLTRSGAVKLCDFGLTALATGGGDSARPYGSPGYASPEQLATPAEVDERADIYGLGCTMWHLAVGRRPFAGPAKEAFEQAKTTDLCDPSTEGVAVSTRFAQIVRRMARADRASRYRDWDECLLDLMLVEKGSPPFVAHFAEARGPDAGATTSLCDAATSSGTSTTEPPLGEVRRGLGAVGIAATYAALLVVGFGLAFLLRSDPLGEMRSRARALASSGRAPEAARLLRDAARIASPEDSLELLREADAIEKK